MLRASPVRCIYQYRFGHPSLKEAFGSKIPVAADSVAPNPGKIQSTTLPNGVRVVSHDLDGAHTALGVYADAGPKYDPVATPGLSYVMRFAIQTSNMENSLFQIDRTMRSVGNAYGHGEIGKRFLSWKAEGRRDMWEKPFEMLATGIVAPRFHETDIERFRDTMDNQLDEQRWQQPREYAVDQLERIAFFKEPLGSPRMVYRVSNDRCNHQALLEQWAARFQPKNIVIAGVNVPHDALVAAYESLPYKHSAEAPHHVKASAPTISNANELAQYYSGRHEIEFEDRAAAMGTMPDMQAEFIAAVGVPTYGREEGAKKYATALVVSEIYAANAARTYAIPSLPHSGVQTFYRPYSTAGLIGYTIRGSPSELDALIKTATSCFPTSIDDGALSRARDCAALHFADRELGVVRDYCDFIATSPNTAEEMIAAIKAVSKADVEECFNKMTTYKPCSIATGVTFKFPVLAGLHKV